MKIKYTPCPYISAALILVVLSSILYGQRSRFDGTWRTTQGKMTTIVDGSRVTGSYAGGGEIIGRLSVDGSILAGTWRKDDDFGRILLRMLPQSNGFSGRWWHDAKHTSGEWIGVSAADGLADGAADVADFSGSWLSNYGRMALQVSGKTISGTFKGLFNSGTIRGNWEPGKNRLVANWSDNKHKGIVILKIMDGKGSLAGEWWYDDHEYGGFWYGVRPAALSGCLGGDCKDGRGNYLWSDGSRYEGEWSNGIYDGTGTHYDPFGKVVSAGYWKEGIYIGQCLNGNCEEGSGKMRLFNGDIYEGLFHEGIAEGSGKYTFKNGDAYEGVFKSGQFSKKGYLEWKSTGDSYNGQFFRGTIQGRGTYVSQDKNVYEGLFRKGKRHGKGKQTWENGDFYEGEWENDEMNGKGRYRFRHGDEYTGNFKDNLRDGQGSYKFADERVVEALWSEDKIAASDNNSAYNGLASATENGGLPGMLPTRHPGETRAISSAEKGVVYLCIYNEETEYPDTEDIKGYKEIKLNYVLLEGSDTLSVDGARKHLLASAVFDANTVADIKIEKVTTGTHSLIRRVFSRYRFDGSDIRLNPVAHEYIYMNSFKN